MENASEVRLLMKCVMKDAERWYQEVARGDRDTEMSDIDLDSERDVVAAYLDQMCDFDLPDAIHEAQETARSLIQDLDQYQKLRDALPEREVSNES